MINKKGVATISNTFILATIFIGGIITIGILISSMANPYGKSGLTEFDDLETNNIDDLKTQYLASQADSNLTSEAGEQFEYIIGRKATSGLSKEKDTLTKITTIWESINKNLTIIKIPPSVFWTVGAIFAIVITTLFIKSIWRYDNV
jgi:hypothetical protein